MSHLRRYSLLALTLAIVVCALFIAFPWLASGCAGQVVELGASIGGEDGLDVRVCFTPVRSTPTSMEREPVIAEHEHCIDVPAEGLQQLEQQALLLARIRALQEELANGPRAQRPRPSGITDE